MLLIEVCDSVTYKKVSHILKNDVAKGEKYEKEI